MGMFNPHLELEDALEAALVGTFNDAYTKFIADILIIVLIVQLTRTVGYYH